MPSLRTEGYLMIVDGNLRWDGAQLWVKSFNSPVRLVRDKIHLSCKPIHIYIYLYNYTWSLHDPAFSRIHDHFFRRIPGSIQIDAPCPQKKPIWASTIGIDETFINRGCRISDSSGYPKKKIVHSKPSHVLLQISSRPKAHEAHHPQRGNTCPQGKRFPQNMRLRAIIIESS